MSNPVGTALSGIVGLIILVAVASVTVGFNADPAIGALKNAFVIVLFVGLAAIVIGGLAAGS